VEERDKRQLEGLLQARSEDMRHGRRPRGRRVATQATGHSVPPASGPEAGRSVRSCDECGGEIGARRLRAMPRAMLCLACQRSAEQAAITP
jgi:hypothetical protein